MSQRKCRDLSKSTNSAAAVATSSLTIVTSNSSIGGQLDVGGPQPAGPLLGILGPATDQPALQFLPAGRREEHQQGLGHALANLPRALEVDLQQHRTTRRQMRLDRQLRRVP